MTNSPLFSIIIPCYNAERTIKKCISSITEQTFGFFEIILVDGKSSDNTLHIAESFNDSRIVIISEKDNGIYDAMNKGIFIAKGEYIFILGSDDCLADTNILRQVEILTQQRAELILGSVENLNKEHQLVPSLYKNKWNSSLYFRNSIHQQGCFYRREIILNHPFDTKFKVLADYDLHLYLYRKNIQPLYCSEKIALCDARGISKKFDYSLYKEEFEIKKKHFSGLFLGMMYLWIQVKYFIKKITS